MAPKSAVRVLFVWPYGHDYEQVLPLSIAYFRNNIKDKNIVLDFCDLSFSSEVSFGDCFTDKLSTFKPDCVAISAWSRTVENALEIGRLTKRYDKNIITLLGGIGVTSMSNERVDEILRDNEMDHLVRGEAELSIESMLLQLTNNNGSTSDRRLTECAFIKDLDLINPPNLDFIDLKRYIENGYFYPTTTSINVPIITTRGCPYKCKFCSAPQISGSSLRKHSVSYVKEEILRLYKTYSPGTINILDDNFTFDINWAKQVCDMILSLGLKDLTFSTMNGIRLQRIDRELVKLMKACGWTHVVVAPESGSKKILKSVSKGLDPEEVSRKVCMIREEGLRVHGFFMIGLPEETPETIKETEEMIMNTDFNTVGIARFQPLPGTPLFEELVQKKEISKDFIPSGNWIVNSDFKYTPPNFTNKELNDIRRRIAIKFYMRPSKALSVLKQLRFRQAFNTLVNYVRP